MCGTCLIRKILKALSDISVKKGIAQQHHVLAPEIKGFDYNLAGNQSFGLCSKSSKLEILSDLRKVLFNRLLKNGLWFRVGA